MKVKVTATITYEFELTSEYFTDEELASGLSLTELQQNYLQNDESQIIECGEISDIQVVEIPS